MTNIGSIPKTNCTYICVGGAHFGSAKICISCKVNRSNIGGFTELNYFDGGKMFFSCETLNTDPFARAIIVACSLHTLNMSKFCNIISTTQVELQVKEPEWRIVGLHVDIELELVYTHIKVGSNIVLKLVRVCLFLLMIVVIEIQHLITILLTNITFGEKNHRNITFAQVWLSWQRRQLRRARGEDHNASIFFFYFRVKVKLS